MDKSTTIIILNQVVCEEDFTLHGLCRPLNLIFIDLRSSVDNSLPSRYYQNKIEKSGEINGIKIVYFP